jgi:hypothetical protein
MALAQPKMLWLSPPLNSLRHVGMYPEKMILTYKGKNVQIYFRATSKKLKILPFLKIKQDILTRIKFISKMTANCNFLIFTKEFQEIKKKKVSEDQNNNSLTRKFSKEHEQQYKLGKNIYGKLCLHNIMEGKQ